MRHALLILGLLAAASPAAAASEIAAGRQIAQRCKSCHAIGARGASPNAKAPPFRTLARRYPLENLQEGFAEGIVVGHSDGMPNFRLRPAQISDLLAYLQSIQR